MFGNPGMGLTFPAAPVADTTYTLTGGEWQALKTYLAGRARNLPGFYWRVKGADVTGELVKVSAVNYASIGGVINLISPPDGIVASRRRTPPTFAWTDTFAPWGDPGAELGQYVVQLSTSAQFTGRVVEYPEQGTSAQTFTLDRGDWFRLDRKLRVGGFWFRRSTDPVTVYWRVVARDQDGLLTVPSQEVRSLIWTR
jgi:hypothetical protein